jgi:hypothetical protein
MTHNCPGPECTKQIPYDQLACSRHWYQVPRPIRNAVYRAWANGDGVGTQAHLSAMQAAIGKMTPLPPPKGKPSDSPRR